MKKTRKKKGIPLTVPAGVTKYLGPTKGLRKFLDEPASLTSGGCRSASGQGALQPR